MWNCIKKYKRYKKFTFSELRLKYVEKEEFYIKNVYLLIDIVLIIVAIITQIYF